MVVAAPPEAVAGPFGMAGGAMGAVGAGTVCADVPVMNATFVAFAGADCPTCCVAGWLATAVARGGAEAGVEAVVCTKPAGCGAGAGCRSISKPAANTAVPPNAKPAAGTSRIQAGRGAETGTIALPHSAQSGVPPIGTSKTRRSAANSQYKSFAHRIVRSCIPISPLLGPEQSMSVSEPLYSQALFGLFRGCLGNRRKSSDSAPGTAGTPSISCVRLRHPAPHHFHGPPHRQQCRTATYTPRRRAWHSCRPTRGGAVSKPPLFQNNKTTRKPVICKQQSNRGARPQR
jgi:hypothetical protein